MAKAYTPDLDSPLFALAHVLVKLLKDVDHENVPALTEDMSLDIHIPSVDIDPLSREMSPPQDFEQPVDPSTLHNPMVDQLTQELTQSVSRNEEYVNITASLQQENKDLCLEVKTIEDLNKINLSHRSQQERCAILKSQAQKLKFKTPASSTKSKVVANTTQPSS